MLAGKENGIIVPIEMPKTCADCLFHAEPIEFALADQPGNYTKISKCIFAPESIDDPWHSLVWQCENKEEWCPLRENGQKE